LQHDTELFANTSGHVVLTGDDVGTKVGTRKVGNVGWTNLSFYLLGVIFVMFVFSSTIFFLEVYEVEFHYIARLFCLFLVAVCFVTIPLIVFNSTSTSPLTTFFPVEVIFGSVKASIFVLCGMLMIINEIPNLQLY